MIKLIKTMELKVRMCSMAISMKSKYVLSHDEKSGRVDTVFRFTTATLIQTRSLLHRGTTWSVYRGIENENTPCEPLNAFNRRECLLGITRDAFKCPHARK